MFLPTVNHAQSAPNTTDFKQGIYNIGLGSVIGGVGAVINKKPDEKTGKVFLRGALQGALGGYLVFESKRMIREFGKTENYSYVWGSKIVNAAGNSIIENASNNNRYWESWHINFGFNRIEFNPRSTESKIKYRIMPFSLIATASAFTVAKLNLARTAKTGTFVFTAEKLPYSKIVEAHPLGLASLNSIIIAYGLESDHNAVLTAHELIHTYQYEELSGFNAFLKPVNQQLDSKYNTVKTYHKYFYTDWNALIKMLSYSIDNNLQLSLNSYFLMF
jgi:hypothetical protein